MVAHIHQSMERLAAHIYQPSTVSVFTDTSGSWGCGAIDGDNWFQCAWHPSWKNVNIATKELVPIILTIGTWGQYSHPVSIRQHGSGQGHHHQHLAHSTGQADQNPVRQAATKLVVQESSCQGLVAQVRFSACIKHHTSRFRFVARAGRLIKVRSTD